MDNNILLLAILILTFITALSQVFILMLDSRPNSSGKDSGSEEDNDDLSKSREIIHEAQEKAVKILANAELKGIEFLSRQKLDISKIQTEYAKSIKELEINLTNQFRGSLSTADKSYQDFLQVLQENIRQQELANQRNFQEKTTKLVENAQTTMTAFIVDINSKVSHQIDDELKAVRNELEMYKKHRMEIINKYIIDILERTLEETLGKKLTLQEHSELIFQALDKAKIELKT